MYIFPQFDLIIDPKIPFSNDDLETRRIQGKLISGLKRKKKFSENDILEFIKSLGFHIKTCPFCGTDRFPIKLIFEINNNEILLVGVHYEKFVHNCSNKACPGRKLNKNSVAFVSVAYNLNKHEALDHIHKRNSSPFYSINHQSEEEYKISQSRTKEWFEERGKDWDAYRARQGYTNTIDYFVSKYNSTEEYYEVCKKRTPILYRRNTLSKREFIEWYFVFLCNTLQVPFLLEIEKFKDYIITKAYCIHKHQVEDNHSTNNIIKLIFNTFIKFGCLYYRLNIKNVIKSIDMVDLIKYVISNKTNKHSYYLSEEKFNKFVDRSADKSIEKIEMGKFSYVIYMKNGVVLKSKNEYLFYSKLIEIGVREEDILHDKRYKDSMFRYDFYIIPLDMYVEIAGMMHMDDYVSKMSMKQNKFNSVIVSNEADMKCIISDINDKLKDQNYEFCCRTD